MFCSTHDVIIIGIITIIRRIKWAYGFIINPGDTPIGHVPIGHIRRVCLSGGSPRDLLCGRLVDVAIVWVRVEAGVLLLVVRLTVHVSKQVMHSAGRCCSYSTRLRRGYLTAGRSWRAWRARRARVTTVRRVGCACVVASGSCGPSPANSHV